MDLSIIIPVYNAAALIDRCLDSVFNQTTGYAYEVICVDDGSKDNSVALIEGRNNPNIRVVKQQNAGRRYSQPGRGGGTRQIHRVY